MGGRRSLPPFGIMVAMVRSKDLVLFIVILVMLALAISATVAKRMLERGALESTIAAQESSPDYGATAAPADTLDRASTIERLKAQLAAGDVIDSAPSVEDPVMTTTTESVPGTQLSCAAPSTGIEIARSWPLKNVEVKVVGGSRLAAEVLYGITTETTASGTISAPTVLSERTLLQLPVSPLRQADPVCLDSEIIGITLEGSLMFNGDAVLYKNTSSETLIGYARDGYPIYGAYYGERDTCGGYESATGYRYTVAPTSPTIINCFSGAPRSFNP